jgi:RNA 2',3'-cyclic 3'-phosphodiesterase
VSDERARLFVALELPGEVREALVSWRADALRGIDGLRQVTADGLHVTLCFLGGRAVSDIAPAASACRIAACEPAARLGVGEAIWLPARRPRVLAVELSDADGALGRVQSVLGDELAAGGWYTPESRQFLAHVTVARVAKGARLSSRELPAPPPIGFEGRRVTLYRSRLSPGGARYEPLATVELGSGGPGVS